MTERGCLRTWTHEPLDRSVCTALARLARIEDVAVVAAMPDVHLAKAVCVGAVVATRSALFPDAVGGDIGCGMAAVRFAGDARVLANRKTAARVLSMLGRRVPTTSRRSALAALPAMLDARGLSSPILERKKSRVGRTQFATLGKGNHFVEFQRDEDGGLWLMLHSGSRGIGQGWRAAVGASQRRYLGTQRRAGNHSRLHGFAELSRDRQG